MLQASELWYDFAHMKRPPNQGPEIQRSNPQKANDNPQPRIQVDLLRCVCLFFAFFSRSSKKPPGLLRSFASWPQAPNQNRSSTPHVSKTPKSHTPTLLHITTCILLQPGRGGTQGRQPIRVDAAHTLTEIEIEAFDRPLDSERTPADFSTVARLSVCRSAIPSGRTLASQSRSVRMPNQQRGRSKATVESACVHSMTTKATCPLTPLPLAYHHTLTP